MPCEAKAEENMEAKLERETRARADFIVKWLIGLSSGQVAAVCFQFDTLCFYMPVASEDIDFSSICTSRVTTGAGTSF